MADESKEKTGRVDSVSVLFVLGGIPAMVAFFVLLFTLGVKGCGVPA